MSCGRVGSLVPPHLWVPTVDKGAREGEPAWIRLGSFAHTKKSTSSSLQKSSPRVVLRFGENQRQKEVGCRLQLEHEKANKPCGFSDLFFLGSFKRAFAITGNKFLEMRSCYYSQRDAFTGRAGGLRRAGQTPHRHCLSRGRWPPTREQSSSLHQLTGKLSLAWHRVQLSSVVHGGKKRSTPSLKQVINLEA